MHRSLLVASLIPLAGCAGDPVGHACADAGSMGDPDAGRRDASEPEDDAVDGAPSVDAAADSARPEPGEPARFHLFVPAWRQLGGQDPAAVAQRFTIIIGGQDPAPFHAGNPDAVVLRYTAGPYANRTQKDALLDSHPYPVDMAEPGGLARYAYGRDCPVHRQGDARYTDPNESCIINVPQFPDFWLVLPDAPEWLAALTTLVQDRLSRAPDLDGIFVDSLGTAAVDSCGPGYVDNAPIDPSTGEPFCSEEGGKQRWLDAEGAMLATVREAADGFDDAERLLAFNGLGPGARYWGEPGSRAVLDYSEAHGVAVFAAMSESIWRQARAPVWEWPGHDAWKSDVRMVQDVETRGVRGLWWTKCWGNDLTSCLHDRVHEADDPGDCTGGACTAADLERRWRRFAIASYLLATGPLGYFNYDSDKTNGGNSNAAEWYPEYDEAIALGAAVEDPIDPDVPAPGTTAVYRRAFEHGLVLVNVAGAPSPELDLDRAYVDLDGVEVASLVLAAHSAALLVAR